MIDTGPLQVAPNLIPASLLLVVAVVAAVLLWRMGIDGGGRPDVRELPDGTRLGPAERAAAVAGREYVLDAEGPVTVGEIREEVFPDHRAGYRSAGAWWAKAVGPALDHDAAIEVPRRGDGVALAGTVDAVDDPPEDPIWFPEATPPPGERFGHALERRRDRYAQVRVSDGRHVAKLRVHDADDVRVVSWEGEDVSVDWLADAREHVREAVRAGVLPGGGDGNSPGDPAGEGPRTGAHDHVEDPRDDPLDGDDPRDDPRDGADPPDGDRAPGGGDRPRERESGREP